MEYKILRNIHNITSHIDTIILGMETPKKTQDGKTVATVRYRFYYEKIWNFYNHCKFTQTRRMQYLAESLGKSQLNLNTLLCSVRPSYTKLGDLAARFSIFPAKSSVRLSLPVCILSLSKYKCVFSPPIDLSFITLGKGKTLISLSL